MTAVAVEDLASGVTGPGDGLVGQLMKRGLVPGDDVRVFDEGYVVGLVVEVDDVGVEVGVEFVVGERADESGFGRAVLPEDDQVESR